MVRLLGLTGTEKKLIRGFRLRVEITRLHSPDYEVLGWSGIEVRLPAFTPRFFWWSHPLLIAFCFSPDPRSHTGKS